MKRSERLAQVAAWRKSGLSRAEYCREQRLNYGTFSTWIKLEEETKGMGGKFVVLPEGEAKGQIRISFANGIRVEYNGRLDEHLIQLLQDA